MNDQPSPSNLSDLGCALFIALPIFACGYLAGVNSWFWSLVAVAWFAIGPMVLDLLGLDPPGEGP